MIPKIAHFYWGNEKMSFLRYMTLYSFRKFHSDWEIRLVRRRCTTNKKRSWKTHETQDAFNYTNTADYTNRLKDLHIKFIDFDFPTIERLDPDMSDIHISDILGWYNLSTVGGINIDMDILFTRSVTPLIREYDQRLINVCLLTYQESCPPPFDNFPRNEIYPIGFLVGTPENEFWETVYNTALCSYDATRYQSAGSEILKRVASELVEAEHRTLRFATLPPYLIYPFAPNPEIYFYDGIKMLWTGNYMKHIPKSSAGVHWYGGDVASQRFNNLITEDNYKQFNSTVCNLIKDIYETPPNA